MMLGLVNCTSCQLKSLDKIQRLLVDKVAHSEPQRSLFVVKLEMGLPRSAI